MWSNEQWYKFVEESNRIEGILRPPTEEELVEFERFMKLDEITLKDLIQFVWIYQPGAELRDRTGYNVRIGNYIPPVGDITIRTRLEDIIADANRERFYDKEWSAHELHIRYESLHPFTDGNGRSGRMLWAWMMQRFPLGFLHTFYYQTLANSDGRK